MNCRAVALAERDNRLGIGEHSHPILIVDDDRAVRESLRFVLAGEGFAVSVATSVDEAAQLLAGQRFEVVITDLSLPGGGRRWVDYLRSAQSDAAVIVVTAVDVRSPPVDALRDVVFAVLGKPAPADHLLDAVERATQRGSQDAE